MFQPTNSSKINPELLEFYMFNGPIAEDVKEKTIRQIANPLQAIWQEQPGDIREEQQRAY